MLLNIMLYVVVVYLLIAVFVGGWLAADEKNILTQAVCGVCWPLLLMSCILGYFFDERRKY